MLPGTAPVDRHAGSGIARRYPIAGSTDRHPSSLPRGSKAIIVTIAISLVATVIFSLMTGTAPIFNSWLMVALRSCGGVLGIAERQQDLTGDNLAL